jgi:hypothetical protein
MDGRKHGFPRTRCWDISYQSVPGMNEDHETHEFHNTKVFFRQNSSILGSMDVRAATLRFPPALHGKCPPVAERN